MEKPRYWRKILLEMSPGEDRVRPGECKAVAVWQGEGGTLVCLEGMKAQVGQSEIYYGISRKLSIPQGKKSIHLHRSDPLLENGLDRRENRYGRYGFATFFHHFHIYRRGGWSQSFTLKIFFPCSLGAGGRHFLVPCPSKQPQPSRVFWKFLCHFTRICRHDPMDVWHKIVAYNQITQRTLPYQKYYAVVN